MRDYSKISSSFWTGETGKKLHGDLSTQVIALYLMTSPHANMIGVYYCPLLFIAHETGSPIEGASKALQRLSEEAFCSYDSTLEIVWVHEMAKYQIGDKLKESDKRVKNIQKQYNDIPNCPKKLNFYNRYSDCF